MPCYNVISTVDEALSSLISQTLSDFEVVAVDDGSTDGSLNRLQDWASCDQRIKILALSHQGIIKALNNGIEACGSAYIARMDADDRAMPSRLSKQVGMLDKYRDFAVVSSLVRGFPQEELSSGFVSYISWLNSLSTDEELKRSIFVHSPLSHPSVAYRHAWINRLGGYQDNGWAEDYDLWMRSYLSGAKFGKVPEVLLEWRDHPQRLTHTDSRYSLNSDLRLKAHYLVHGPLSNASEVIIWGLTTETQLLGKLLIQLGCPLAAFIGSHLPHVDVSELIVPLISPEVFCQNLNPNHVPTMLFAGDNLRTDAMFTQQLSALQLSQGVDWYKIA